MEIIPPGSVSFNVQHQTPLSLIIRPCVALKYAHNIPNIMPNHTVGGVCITVLNRMEHIQVLFQAITPDNVYKPVHPLLTTIPTTQQEDAFSTVQDIHSPSRIIQQEDVSLSARLFLTFTEMRKH